MFQLGPDPCVFWVCLDTMVRQLRATGDTNLASYSRHLATHHQLQLSSCQLYIQVNRYPPLSIISIIYIISIISTSSYTTPSPGPYNMTSWDQKTPPSDTFKQLILSTVSG